MISFSNSAAAVPLMWTSTALSVRRTWLFSSVVRSHYEQFFRAMHEQHKLPYAGMRYMNIYGPRMDYRGTYVSVIMKVLDLPNVREATYLPRDVKRLNP